MIKEVIFYSLGLFNEKVDKGPIFSYSIISIIVFLLTKIYEHFIENVLFYTDSHSFMYL
jgi:hypothetical protein